MAERQKLGVEDIDSDCDFSSGRRLGVPAGYFEERKRY